MSTTVTRRAKWQYPPPPPTPRILHLPRRSRRRQLKTVAPNPTSAEARRNRQGKLETLFGEERVFSRTGVPIVLLDYGGEASERRVRVEESSSERGTMEEKWRFQAEMLRAECNLLRMEKEIAVKSLEKSRVKMERTLRSAIHTLVSGRNKICEGKNVSVILEETIQITLEKLDKLQRSSRVKGFEVKNYSNFDKQASLLRRRLEKFEAPGDEICVKEIQEMAEASLSIKAGCGVDESFVSSGKYNVEILRKKMEGLSKGILLDKMEEEYRSILSTSSSCASSSKQLEFPKSSSSSIRQPDQETMSGDNTLCTGHCKAIVRRVIEQVRIETEQWSQMQKMLGQVRKEMEELQASRDFWEDRALNSDYQIQSLKAEVQEWREKAFSSESKVTELQGEMSVLRQELECMKKEQNSGATRATGITQDVQNEMEKRVLVCRLKENHCTVDNISKDRRRKVSTSTAPKRSPFLDIGNSSLLMRQNSRAIFPLHCPLPSNTETYSRE